MMNLGRVLFAAVWFLAQSGFGQCAMCARTAQAQQRSHAEALNRGIFLLLLPASGGLALVAALAWRRR